MSHRNRELVEFFICYKLSQNNYPSSLLRPDVARTDIDAVKAALRDTADEFQLVYTLQYDGLFSLFNMTPDTDYESFKCVMDEMFQDQINWGRIVALFVFGGALCVECAQKDMSNLVPQIAGWMTTYLDEHISPWMESAGGWDRFGESFGHCAAARGRRSREKLKRWLQTGAVVLLGMLIIGVVAKKL